MGWLEPGGPFTAILFDKVLTHLHNPLESLRKASQVASPKARILILNLDGMATTVNAGLDPEDRTAVDKILAWRARYGTVSGWASTSTPSIFLESGWQYVSTNSWTIAFTRLTDAEQYTPLLDYGTNALAENAITQDDCNRWERVLTENPATFSCTLNVRADLGIRVED